MGIIKRLKVGEMMATVDELCMKEIGKRITECRHQLGLTQEQLADNADLSPQFISYAESGKRAMRPENLIKLSAALNVSVDYLLTGFRSDREITAIYNKFFALSPKQQKAVELIIDDLIHISKE